MLADDLTLAVGKLFADKFVKLFGIDFQLHVILDVYPAAENVRDGKRVPLGIRFDGIVYVYLGQLVLDLSEVHFYLISYYTSTETLVSYLNIGKVKIIPAKKPGYSLLCSKNIDTLPLGDQLRVMRLRTGLTIEQAARAIGVERRRAMNYELGKVKRMKAEVVSKLIELYNNDK